MDSKKYEKLIELIINENEEAAKALLHDIVVEKSREIYESIMEMDDDRDMGGQVGDLLDEIDGEEAGHGMHEAEEELDIEVSDDEEGEEKMSPMDGMDGMDDEMAPMDAGIEDGEEVEFSAGEEGEGQVEDMLADIKDELESQGDKLSRLLADFEKKVNGSDMADEEGDEEAEAGAEEAEAGAEEAEMDAEEDEEEGEKLAEAKLTPVRVQHPASAASRSPSLTKPGAVASGKGHPVNFSAGGSAAGKTATVPQSSRSYQNAGAGHGVKQSPAPAAQRKPAAGSSAKSPISGGVKR